MMYLVWNRFFLPRSLKHHKKFHQTTTAHFTNIGDAFNFVCHNVLWDVRASKEVLVSNTSNNMLMVA